MKTYVVGGAVRDQLLGRVAQDKDYVVTGITPEGMIQKGFLPVGQDFPVFLHPETKEEYALARTERKSGKGYKGFTFFTSPDVTLEEDLLRRDFTVNAMAQELDMHGRVTGDVIDPFGGQQDLNNRVFRHVSHAFEEDPLRVLRLGRFLARFKDFVVAPDTLSLVKKMVQSGELRDLVPERVWQEISRGLMEVAPEKMWQYFHDTGVIQELFPKVYRSENAFKITHHGLSKLGGSSLMLPSRLAVLLITLSEHDIEEWCESNKVPLESKSYAIVFCKLQELFGHPYTAEDILKFSNDVDAWRKPQRLQDIYKVAQILDISVGTIPSAILAAQEVDGGVIAKEHPELSGKTLGDKISRERLKAISAFL